MTRSRTRIAVVVLSLGFVASACRQPPAPQEADRARRAAAVAGNPDQARLWQEAADQGTAIGLERLAVANRPVTPRRQVAPVAQAKPAQPAQQPAQVVIPPRVETQLRILAAPAVGEKGYSGAATVTGASGDRLELDLGQPGHLVVLARAAKAPIPVTLKEQVRLVYLASRDPGRLEEVLVIRTAAGKGIGSIVQGGHGPIKMTVPLFGVTAAHAGEPNSSRVTVGLGNEPPQSLAPGRTVRLGDVFVRVVGSYARTGSAAASAEGLPYVINLLIWSP